MRISPAEYVILSFGGVRATARALGKGPSTICKWKKEGKGNVPSRVQVTILTIARARRLDITAHDLVFGRNINKKLLTH